MNKEYKRIFVIVCDSMGIGNAEDAEKFGDKGANTIAHICDVCGGLKVLNLEGLGLGNLGNFKGIHPIKHHLGTIAALKEVSNGKDTMTGHWEMMGLKVEKPFLTFTETGFPEEFIKLFEEKTGRKCLGNYASSGTVILDELGEEQIKTGQWIVYTSADSVFQIAANEEIISLEELYKACEIARDLLMKDEWKVGRVIARPYIGKKKGEFKRTPHRHDYALKPFNKTVLDSLKENGYDVVGVGKIPDIFDHAGITEEVHTDNKFDEQLTDLMKEMNDDDLLMITADHGNDPTWTGTDHTREHVPLIIYSKTLMNPVNLGVLESYAVIGATIADNFNVENPGIGYSILNELKRDDNG